MNSDSFPVWILERRERGEQSDFTFDFLYTTWDVTSASSLKFTSLLHNIHPAASSASPAPQGPGLCGLQLKHTHKMMSAVCSQLQDRYDWKLSRFQLRFVETLGRVCALTQHSLRNGKSDGGSSRHPPPGREVGDFSPQHLHDHLVVQGQVELLVVDELGSFIGRRWRDEGHQHTTLPFLGRFFVTAAFSY